MDGCKQSDPEGGRDIGRSVQVEPLLKGRPSVRAGCINTRTPLLKGCAGERIGTRYLRPGGTSPLKGASLIMGMYKFTIRQEGDVKDAPYLGNATSEARKRPLVTAHFKLSVGGQLQG